MSGWNFGADILLKAQSVSIGARVKTHHVEAEYQSEKATVVGINIERYGNVFYTILIDGEDAPTDGYVFDAMGKKPSSIQPL